MTNLTPERLAEIKARCKEHIANMADSGIPLRRQGVLIALFGISCRQDIPALLAEVEWLQAENEDMADTLECCTKCREEFPLADGRGGYIGDDEL